MAEMGEKLWEPGADICRNANITNFMRWLGDSRNLEFDDYESLWKWSVSDIEAFWKAIWDYFELTSSVQPGETLDSRDMPRRGMVPGSENQLRGVPAGAGRPQTPRRSFSPPRPVNPEP